MSSVLVVGGDQIDGIKKALNQRGVNEVNHWDGRKVGDSHKVIPYNTNLIVLVTKFISHSFTHKIKHLALKRGLPVLYVGSNGASQLKLKLEGVSNVMLDGCRKTIHYIYSILKFNDVHHYHYV